MNVESSPVASLTPPGGRRLAPRPVLRGVAALSGLVMVSDWSLKLAHPLLAGSWFPHRVDRPALLMILVSLTLAPAAAVLLARPLTTWGVGLLLGGTLANMIDLLLHGVVWDMLHWGDRVFNLADVAIASGWVLLALGVLDTLRWVWRPARASLAPDN